jgi:hypothetical protein
MSLQFSSFGKNICTVPASISRHTTCHPFKRRSYTSSSGPCDDYSLLQVVLLSYPNDGTPLHVPDNLCFPFLNSKIKISPFILGTRLPRSIIYILALICIFHLITSFSAFSSFLRALTSGVLYFIQDH